MFHLRPVTIIVLNDPIFMVISFLCRTGGTITVSGSNFGLSGKVLVGSVTGDLVSYSDTEVIFEVSGLSAGAQDVKVGGDDGYALSG